MSRTMSTRYKVTRLIGYDEDTGHMYRFSHEGTQKWDCQSMWASAVKAGNTETVIMVSKQGATFVPDEDAMAYARKRFNLDGSGYDIQLYEAVREHIALFTEIGKKIKKIEQTAEDFEKAVAQINYLYDLLNEKRADLENAQSESAN